MDKTNIVTAAALLLAFGLVGCQQKPAPANEFDVTFLDTGQEIAMTHCTACHSIDSSGESPRTDAPPLRTVLANNNPEALAEDFREHIHVGHPDMPDFDFTAKETEGLLAYLRSIQETPE